MPWSRFTAEQYRAAFLVDRHVLASAGAGSGKTTVMAVRYVASLLSPLAGPEKNNDSGLTTPDRILGLTFTTEAAGNLRARIDKTLRAVLHADCFPKPWLGAEEPLQLSAAERTHLRRCLGELPSAPLTTVDGACLAWVTEGAALLGRDPDHTPAEPLRWAAVRARAWAKVRTAAAAELVPLIARYGEFSLRAALIARADQASALPSGLVTGLTGDPYPELLARRAAELHELPEALTAAGRPERVTTAKAELAQLMQELDKAVARGATKAALQYVQDLIALPCERPADGSRHDKVKRRRRGSLASLIDWDVALDADLTADTVRAVQVIQTYQRVLAEEAAAAGVASFAGIEAEALQLLAEPEFAQRLANRYRQVLLDEAQDLNRLQASLIEAIQRALPNGAGPRIFTVGDHRQSIFGFRHADPQIFAGWEQSLAADGGEVVVLAENFRSHPELVAGFSRIFAEPAFRPEAIKPGREPKGSAVLAAWRVVGIDPEADDSELQAAFVAERIATSEQPPSAHVILLRSRGRMLTYARALEARGIPCDTDFPEGLIQAQEVADVEAILRLALNPGDRNALAVALGGPWGTEDPQDKRLLVEALETDLQRALRETPLGELVVAIRTLAAAEGPASAVRALVNDPRLTRRYGQLPLARRRVANLQALAEEEHRAGVTLDLAGFCERLRERRLHRVDEAEASGAGLGACGVRLMTIHGAKGLEWPVVWLPELHRRHSTRDLIQPFLAVPVGDELHLCCRPGTHDSGMSLRAELTADDLWVRGVQEERRLFYVACTRAREELHLLAAQEVAPADLRGLTTTPAGWVTIPWAEVPVDLQQVTPWEADQEDKPAAPLAPDFPAEPPPPLLVVRSVTELVQDQHAPDATASGYDASIAQALGIAVHAALAANGIGMSTAQAEAALAGFTDVLLEERYQRLLAGLTDATLIPGYWEGERLTEQPLIGERGGEIISAQIDLLLKRDGAWHLYDFKTGAAAISASSAAQLRWYAELVEPLLDAPVADLWLVDVEARRAHRVGWT